MQYPQNAIHVKQSVSSLCCMTAQANLTNVGPYAN
jgi:hypothetical protein